MMKKKRKMSAAFIFSALLFSTFAFTNVNAEGQPGQEEEGSKATSTEKMMPKEEAKSKAEDESGSVTFVVYDQAQNSADKMLEDVPAKEKEEEKSFAGAMEYLAAQADTQTWAEWTGPVLNKSAGTIMGPSGKETYYNLPMQGVVDIMRRAGFSEEEYPYWVDDGGLKRLGPYIMVAADLNLRPRGSVIQISLGQAIVADTGTFALSNPTQVDVAVNW